MMTVQDVALRLNCAASTVYLLVESGKLEAFRIGPNGGGIRVSEEQLQQYLDDCRSVPATRAIRRRSRPKLKHIKL
jgi:excisionase family DNA binding protein